MFIIFVIAAISLTSLCAASAPHDFTPHTFAQLPLKTQAYHLLSYAQEAQRLDQLAAHHHADPHWPLIHQALCSLAKNEMLALQQLGTVTYKMHYESKCPEAHKLQTCINDYHIRPDFAAFLKSHAANDGPTPRAKIGDAQGFMPVTAYQFNWFGSFKSFCFCLYHLSSTSGKEIINKIPPATTAIKGTDIPTSSTPATLLHFFSTEVNPPSHKRPYYILAEVPFNASSPINYFIVKAHAPATLPSAFAKMPQDIHLMHTLIKKKGEVSDKKKGVQIRYPAKPKPSSIHQTTLHSNALAIPATAEPSEKQKTHPKRFPPEKIHTYLITPKDNSDQDSLTATFV